MYSEGTQFHRHLDSILFNLILLVMTDEDDSEIVVGDSFSSVFCLKYV